MKDFTDFLKLPPYILGALAFASGLVLFLPESVITKLYMVDFRNNYGFAIGIVFIVSVSILAVLLGIKIYKAIDNKRDLVKLKEAQIKFLKRISGDKVELIKGLISEPDHTAELPFQNGLIIEMQHYHVISPAGQTHLVDMTDPYIKFFLQPWVIERIEEDPELREKFKV